jgi:cytochrome c oxidase assembly protein subunit 11
LNPVRRTAIGLSVVAATMLGAAYAAVPLYRVFCSATGYGGTTQRAEGRAALTNAALARGATRTITVRFDANTAPGMSWDFHPDQVTQQLKIGQRGLAFFHASNPTDARSGGQAAYNVTPDTVGKYFVKIQCFCFNQQTLAPHQSAEMPVIYYIDPAFLDDPEAARVKEVTLSYTFFPAAPAAAGFPAAAQPAKTVQQRTTPQG